MFLIIDTFFLINWLDESDPDLHDVVSAKSVVPPEDVETLDVTEGMICSVFFWSVL